MFEELFENFRKKILVVGSLNIDIVTKVQELPKKGQTIIAEKSNWNFGGKGANQAYAIGQMVGKVELYGLVGDDDYGDEYMKYLHHRTNIKNNTILIEEKYETGVAYITVEQTGDNTIVVCPNANNAYKRQHISMIKKIIDEKDIIVLQLEIPFKVVEQLIEYAFKKKKTIVLNPSPAIKLNDELLSKIDYLIPNETELEILMDKKFSPQTNIKDEAKIFFKQSKVKNLLVTLGDKGAYFINQDEEIEMPAMKVEVVDSTCAGDAFLGAFVAMIAEQGSSHKGAMQLATGVAAMVVTKQGAQQSIPYFGAALTFIEEYED